jgi:hypothetical protein
MEFGCFVPFPCIHFIQSKKGVIPVLTEYKEEVEQLKRTIEEGWDRL